MRRERRGLLSLFKLVDLVEPEGGHGVARHAPVASGREGDGADLRAVGQAAALELLLEEPAEEGAQPVVDGRRVVAVAERLPGQEIDLRRARTETEEVVEEEVVQLVGADQVFRLLADVALLVGGDQLRADGRVDNVEQRRLRALVDLVVGDPFHEIFHQCLGDAAVHAIHRHVVAVVGRPAERQLREVARTDHEPVRLVRHVHQDLGPLAGLAVLVGDVVVVRVMLDILEMLEAGLFDGDLAQRGAQRADQADGVVVGAACRAEAGHRDADDPLARDLERVEGHGRHQKRQRRVEPARDAHDGRLGMGMDQALGQARHLDLEDLLASLGERVARRGEGVRVDPAGQLERPVGQVELDGRPVVHAIVRAALHETGVHPPVVLQVLQVDLADDQLLAHRETRRFAEDDAVLGDDAVAGEDQVGARFAEARRGVDVAGDASARLLGDERPQVMVLADQLVAGRQVEDEVGAQQGQLGAGRDGHPQVLADLDADAGLAGLEDQVAVQRHLAPADRDHRLLQARGRREPALLLELLVGGQVALGHHPEDLALLEGDGGVDQLAAGHQRAADDDQRVEAGGAAHQLDERPLGLAQQDLVREEVHAGIGRHRQLGEGDDLYPSLVGLAGHLLDLLGIVKAVGHPHVGDGRRDFDKSVIHVLTVYVDAAKVKDYYRDSPYPGV